VELNTEKEFSRHFRQQAHWLEEMIASLFREQFSGNARMLEVMQYSLLGGGKRIRPQLVLECGRFFQGSEEDLLLLAMAVEMIHTYSLIHDDLPAMDNDDMRRGKPSSHKRFGEALAILGGDALLTEAFRLPGRLQFQELNRFILEELVDGAGVRGMIAGQVLDLAAEGDNSLTFAHLQTLHRLKTGALINSCLQVGMLSAAASTGQMDEALLKKRKGQIAEYADAIGLLFQITDDILDTTGDEQILGKPIGSDLQNEKTTYVSLLGLSEAKAQAEQEKRRAEQLASDFFTGSQFFKLLPGYILHRSK